MSKMVVGIKRSPAIRPHSIDCGLTKTVRKADSISLPETAFALGLFSCPRRKIKTIPIPTPRPAIALQKLGQARPRVIRGPTANWPADPPDIPNICVAPIRVAACEGGKLVEAM